MKNFFLIINLVLYAGLFSWGYEPVRIGFNPGEGELFEPTIAKEGPDGNVYVFDRKDQLLKVYSPKTGSFLKKIGQSGQGPGEYMSFGSFGFTGNQLFFTEIQGGHRWITFMDLSGKCDKVLKTQQDGNRGIYTAQILPDNHILAQIEFFGDSKKHSGYYWNYYQMWLAIIDPQGNISKIIIKQDRVFSIGSVPAGIGPRVPDFPDFLWEVTKEGHIIFSEGNSNVLQVYNLEGKMIGQLKVPLPDAPKFSSDDLNDWREKTKKEVVQSNGPEFYNKYFSVMDKYNPVYGKKQIIEAILVTPTGNILIRETKKENSKENQYRLITGKGDLLATIRTAAKVGTVSKNLILYTLEDEDENLVLYCLKIEADEKKSLSSI